jgi:hypothetical protein
MSGFHILDRFDGALIDLGPHGRVSAAAARPSPHEPESENLVV